MKKETATGRCQTYKLSSNSEETIKDLVQRYLNYKHAGKERPEVMATDKEFHALCLSALEDKIDYICGKINGKNNNPTPYYQIDNHQRSIRFPQRQYVVKNIFEKMQYFDDMEFHTFEELIGEVEKIQEKYFRETCIYDLALRYGWHLYPRIEPEKYVYVHSKPKRTAKKLKELGYLKEVKRRIPIEDFHEDIRQPGMTAADIEHFLCLYHDSINSIFEKTMLRKNKKEYK